jgi:hypothetical protein
MDHRSGDSICLRNAGCVGSIMRNAKIERSIVEMRKGMLLNMKNSFFVSLPIYSYKTTTAVPKQRIYRIAQPPLVSS